VNLRPIPEWHDQAACTDQALGGSRARARIFYPQWSGHVTKVGSTTLAGWAAAKEICAGCPVASSCLDDAIENDEPDGVWGGLDPIERAVEARRRARRISKEPATA